MSIRNKLLASFGALILLLVLIGTVTFWMMTRLAGSTDEVQANTETISLAAQLRDHLQNLRVHTLRASMAGTPSAAREINQQADADLKQFTDYLHQLKASDLDNQEQAKVKAIEDAFTAYNQARLQTMQLAMDGNFVESQKNATENAGPKYEATYKLIDDLTGYEEKLAADTREAAHASANLAKLGVVIGALAAVAAGAAVALWLTRSITVPLGMVVAASRALTQEQIPSLRRALEALASGDLTVTPSLQVQTLEVKSKDETGQLLNAFNEMGSALCAMACDLASAVASLRDTLANVMAATEQVEAGSRDLEGAAHSTEEMSQQVKRTVAEMARAAQQQASSLSEASNAVEQLSSAIESVAKGASEQSSAIDLTARQSDELQRLVGKLSEAAARAGEAVRKAAEAAHQGRSMLEGIIADFQSAREGVQTSAQEISQMAALSKEIGRILEVIEDIAEQTNLLALNAAIEAARAGEHGRGFAVVADEVRRLAEKTSKSTKEIAEMISGIRTQTEGAVATMNAQAEAVGQMAEQASRAGGRFGEILTQAETSARETEAMLALVAEAERAVREVGRAIERVAAVVQENMAATEEMAAGAGQVKETVQTLAGISEENSAAAEEITAAADTTAEEVERVRGMATRFAQLAAELRSLLSSFTVGHQPTRATKKAA